MCCEKAGKGEVSFGHRVIMKASGRRQGAVRGD